MAKMFSYVTLHCELYELVSDSFPCMKHGKLSFYTNTGIRYELEIIIIIQTCRCLSGAS